MICRPDDGHPDRGGRPRLPRRDRAGRSTGRTDASAAWRCPPGLVESDRLPEPIFTPGDEGRGRRARREHRLRDDGVDRRARDRRAGPRPGDGPVSARGGRDGARRDPARGHQVRVRDRRGDRRDHPHRRGADARFVALLGRGDLRARPRPRRASTSSSSATGSRPSPGTRPHPARPCPTTSWRERVHAMSRRTSGSPARASRATWRRT